MFRFLTIFTFLFCFALCGCQASSSYSTGVVQTAARADEAVVLSTLRTIMVAENAYNASTGSYGTFEQLKNGGYLDSRFNGERPSLHEYSYTIALKETSSGPAFMCNADPERTGDRAGRHYYIDSTSNEIHVNGTQPASAADETLKP